MTMKKISLILAVLCCCISMKAQNVGDECTDCPAIEVTKGAKKVTLYNPEKVEFMKK